jgi:hypothetical protein
MASLHKEIWIEASCESIWDAARDIGALHTRLVPGFVVDTQLEPGARVVKFGNGMSIREPIVSLDDSRRRLVWTSEGGAATHYNAVLHVAAERGGSRVTWTTDFLPDALADTLSGMQDEGLRAMKRHFEATRD